MAQKYTDEEQKLRDSLTGSSYDKQYFTTDELQSASDIVKAASEGTTDWQSAHDYVEGIRNNYGYSGGKDGSQYIQTSKPVANTQTKYTPGYVQSYAELPSYVSQNKDAIDNALNAILNRAAFSYDHTTDPRWQAYKKEYTREGQRATADALGQYAAATGGMPSTAAMTAATQAGDYYAAQMTDKIPELYDIAYGMYQDEGNNLRNNLAVLMDKENQDYNRYLDDLAQYNRDRDFDYNAWLRDQDFGYQQARDAVNDARYDTEWKYQLERDAVGDDRYNNEWNYQVSQDEKDDAFERAKILAQYGDFSGFEAMGFSPEQVGSMRDAYLADQKAGRSGGSRQALSTEEDEPMTINDIAKEFSTYISTAKGFKDGQAAYDYLERMREKNGAFDLATELAIFEDILGYNAEDYLEEEPEQKKQNSQGMVGSNIKNRNVRVSK